MEIHLKINDVVGMDDEKRHIIRVDDESLRRALMEHPKWLTQNVVKEWLLKKPSLLNEIIEDPTLRNVIYMDEKAKREAKSERRERHHQFEIEKRRRQEAHKASIATRKALDFYHDVLGID
jgi:hypothetical protein